MGIPGDPSFDERRKAAAASKAELLNKFKSAARRDDPAVQAKLAKRKAVAARRDARRSERDRQKQEALARVAAEELAATTADTIVDLPPKESASAPASEADVESRKAERDRRYAARKARKR